MRTSTRVPSGSDANASVAAATTGAGSSDASLVSPATQCRTRSRAGLRRGGSTDRGPDLGDEARRRRAQGRWSAATLLLRLSGLLRRRAETNQFLIVGYRVAFAREQIGDLRTFLLGNDDGLAARHYKTGDADLIGEAGIGGFGHDDERLAGRVLFLWLGTMLPPIVRAGEHDEEEHGDAGFEKLRSVHRRITQTWL